MKAQHFAILIAAALSNPAISAPVDGSGNIEVLVEESLYATGEITAAIEQYLFDVQAQGYNPILTTRAFSGAAELRTHLTERYNTDGLSGVVLIGDLPTAYFERENDYGKYGYVRFPIDLYFQDLDGIWSDLDENETFDSHSGDVTPEIMLGRMKTSTLSGLHEGRTETGMLESYLQKNHAYRVGQLSLPPDGLAYPDDDWASQYYGDVLDLSLTGTVTCVTDRATTTADDYTARLRTGEYESLLLAAHSTSLYHMFKSGTGGTIYSSDLHDLNPQVFFYNLIACSAARYTEDGYMAGEYVFGTDKGLLALGSTKTGSMMTLRDFYTDLGAGETFGEALLGWWEDRAGNGFSEDETDWFYGVTLLGDPLLTTQQFRIPEPATTTIAGLFGIAMLRKRRSS